MTKTKQPQASWTPNSPVQNISPSSSGGHPPQSRSSKPIPSSFSDNEEEEEEEEEEEQHAFWDECEQVAKKNPAPSKGITKAGGGPGKGNDRGKKNVGKDEVKKL